MAALKHKWGGEGRKRHAVCKICGCTKDRGVYTIIYKTLDGKITQIAPECLNPLIN